MIISFRSLLRVLMLLGASSVLQAQGLVCQLGSGTSAYNAAIDQQPTGYAAVEMNRIYTTACPAGCGNVFLVQNQTVSNAMAWSMRPGVTKISYNPAFMNRVHYSFGPQASFGILAHEFGHHLDSMFPASWMDSSWNRELRADGWAGCVLARSGLDIRQSGQVLQAIAAYPSSSHPPWQQRVPALRAGYLSCGGARWRW